MTGRGAIDRWGVGTRAGCLAGLQQRHWSFVAP